MTLEEIDAPFRRTVLRAEGDEWDDPETADEEGEDDDELGYRDVDEESSYDERGDQGEDGAS